MTELKPISIIMVGPTRVGKTSMLAAMYNELKQAEKRQDSTSYGLHMKPGSTQGKINEQQEQLEELASKPGVVVNKDDNVGGGAEQRNYDFFINIEKDYQVPLQFADLPGGWYTGNDDSGCEQADKLLQKSHVSLLAVDAVALMEGEEYHKKINRPKCIDQAYDRASFEHDHDVILVLIRAETYARDNKIPQLIKRAQKAYSDLAKTLSNKGIELRGCYIETLGGLIFERYQQSGDSFEAVFRREPKIGYKPSRCDIPLRMVAEKGAKHALDEAVIEREKKEGLWDIVIAFLGFDNALAKARKKNAKLYEAFKHLGSGLDEKSHFFVIPPAP